MNDELDWSVDFGLNCLTENELRSLLKEIYLQPIENINDAVQFKLWSQNKIADAMKYGLNRWKETGK